MHFCLLLFLCVKEVGVVFSHYYIDTVGKGYLILCLLQTRGEAQNIKRGVTFDFLNLCDNMSRNVGK